MLIAPDIWELGSAPPTKTKAIDQQWKHVGADILLFLVVKTIEVLLPPFFNHHLKPPAHQLVIQKLH